jgi:chromosomal replication initiation ATPase DnaA
MARGHLFDKQGMKNQQLPLIDKTDYSQEKWIVSECNAVATKWVYHWQQAMCKFACIYGPNGAGKTHLAMIFKDIAKAQELTPSAETLNCTSRTFIFDDVERFNENWLFNAYNARKNMDGWALFTTRKPPRNWTFRLEDIDSRLKATTLIGIDSPDDRLLKCIAIKQAQDYNMYIDSTTIELLIHMAPRTFEGITAYLKTLNDISIATGMRVSKKMVRNLSCRAASM